MFQLLTVIMADYIMATPCGRDNPSGPYKEIKTQKVNKQQENNLTNQQQKFDDVNYTDGPHRVPLWPCRAAPNMTKPHVWKRGQVITVETQGNNYHAAYMELNLFKGNLVHQALTPTKTGAGFSRSGTTITIPIDFPTCGKSDGCFLQFHLYSREPRNYVTCADFVLEGDVPGVKAEVNSDCPSSSGSSSSNDYYKVQTKGQNATQVVINPVKVKSKMQSVVHYNDAHVFDEVSMDYEPYGGQSKSYPPSALKMWDLTLPAEHGRNGILKNTIPVAERNVKKAFRKVIEELRDAAEIPFRCYQTMQIEEYSKQIYDLNGKPAQMMMENKGTLSSIGYYPAAKNIAYSANLYYKPTPGDYFTPERSMQLLSNPLIREDTTTYIDIVGKCVDQLHDSVMKLAKSNVDDKLANPNAKLGDTEAEKQKVLQVCAAQIQSAGYKCGTTTNYKPSSNPDNMDNMDNKGQTTMERKKPAPGKPAEITHPKRAMAKQAAPSSVPAIPTQTHVAPSSPPLSTQTYVASPPLPTQTHATTPDEIVHHFDDTFIGLGSNTYSGSSKLIWSSLLFISLQFY
eukprot:NODE_344_length_10554_cov_0.516308.p1 type:complete len:569 gc:universal NODE_344_length_10554_cov_0.516308:8405-10111(+)